MTMDIAMTVEAACPETGTSLIALATVGASLTGVTVTVNGSDPKSVGSLTTVATVWGAVSFC